MIFLKPYVIMLGGRFLETGNKICQASGLKRGRGGFKNWAVIAYERVFETVFDWETKRLFTRWSLWESWLYAQIRTLELSSFETKWTELKKKLMTHN